MSGARPPLRRPSRRLSWRSPSPDSRVEAPTMHRLALLIAIPMIYAGVAGSRDDPPGDDAAAVVRDARPRWFRGNLHTHSFWSDGNDYPEMIVDWYARHGYQFLA